MKKKATVRSAPCGSDNDNIENENKKDNNENENNENHCRHSLYPCPRPLLPYDGSGHPQVLNTKKHPHKNHRSPVPADKSYQFPVLVKEH